MDKMKVKHSGRIASPQAMLQSWRQFLLWLTVVAPLATAIDLSEVSTRVAALEAQLASELKASEARQLAELKAQQRIDHLTRDLQAVAAELSSAGAMTSPGRKLQAPSTQSDKTSVAVQSWHIHEFDATHTCGTLTNAYLQPNTDSDFALKAMGSTSSIDTMPSPLKIVHPTNCGATPTLELSLATNVAGSLSVGGLEVSAGPSTVQASPTEAYLQANNAFTFSSPSGHTAFPDLTRTLSPLTTTKTVLVQYQITAEVDMVDTVNRYLACSVWYTEDSLAAVELRSTRSLHGGSSGAHFVTMSGLWMGNLAAGTHKFEVFCRGIIVPVHSTAFATRVLNVLVL